MRVTEVPMPAAVALRPRDPRGYPVPAITPWIDGQPRFAANGTARTFLCAIERRCSVCGLTMAPGPVWRVVSGGEADAIDAVVAAGHPYRNNVATVEAPGHRTCMLYSAVVCPYLSYPTARRGEEVSLPGAEVVRGERRGLGGAVVSFDEVEYRLTDMTLFRFRGLGEFRRHDLGDEQYPALVAALADDAVPTEKVPAYLMADEGAAQARFAAYGDGSLA